MSSYMEVGIDVRPEWPPFSGPEIHVRHTLSSSNMNSPKFSDSSLGNGAKGTW